MPFFKSTYNILVKPDEDEIYDANWFDKPFLTLPPKVEWSYEREMQIEDVDIWEVIVQHGGGLGIYAAWSPYAEFYLVTTGTDLRISKTMYLHGVPRNYNGLNWETYYGPEAQQHVRKRAKDLGLIVPNNKVWVDEEDMWKYTEPVKKTLILP